MFSLTAHSTHLLYDHIVSDSWLTNIHGILFQISSKASFTGSCVLGKGKENTPHIHTQKNRHTHTHTHTHACTQPLTNTQKYTQIIKTNKTK